MKKKRKTNNKHSDMENILFSDDKSVSELNPTKFHYQKFLDKEVDKMNEIKDGHSNHKIRMRLLCKIAQKEIDQEFKPIRRKWG